MKISFLTYGTGELLTQKRLATCIISFVALAVFAGVLGSYLLGNKFWLLTVAVLGIAGILLCLGVATAISLNPGEIDEAPSAPIEENAPPVTSQWDYRPRKANRRYAAVDGAAETVDIGNPNPSATKMNDDVWFSFKALSRTSGRRRLKPNAR
jgi:hypothetical protein